ncbi:hypothetical protein H5399_05090 [Tessaracoccus sp. MC1627]|uniref:phage major capsid protein n=1 Tax=Tessaracoccus sp. MC1627 TaxID=2760312 RepID=UPI0015FFB8BE|nr:hypothetical protein [Tessaracoccus sp. MC1627]MBB1511979.1 hypothetical protein [Tessaracoccus sp. MC1627]
MSFTYPPSAPVIGADMTTVEIHHLLKTPTLLRRRLLDILTQKFIADFLLAGRFQAVGGAILYETGEEIMPADSAEAVAPGGEYPRTVLTSGELAAAKTVKWGLDTPVTDEAISRLGFTPVEKALRKLANGNIRDVDAVALAVIASKITQTISVTTTGTHNVNTGAWSTDDAIIEGVLAVKAKAEELNGSQVFDYNTVVLKPTQFAKVAGKLITGGLVPREQQNAILTGVIPDYLGLTWATSAHVPFTDPMLVDREQLGGMADEALASPGYTGLDGVQVKSIRDELKDSYDLRARRVTVPVVLEPLAGVIIDDTGL